MAKSNYLPGILFIAALLFCGSTAGFCVEYQVSGIKYQVSGFKYQDRSAVTEYGGGFSDSRRKRSLVKHIYDSQIGIREQGTNSGPQIEKYLKYVGLAKGQPWCAAFVCWVYGNAGVTNPRTGWSPDLFPASKIIWERTGKSQPGTRNPVMLPVTGCLLRGGTDKEKVEPFLLPVAGCLLRGWMDKENVEPLLLPVTGCVLRGWMDNENIKPLLLPVTGCVLRGWTDNENINFTQHNLQHATRNPQLTPNRQPATPGPADIFAIYFPDKRRIAHVGFIDQWDENWLITVEGNTNISGGREGDGVYRKRRLIRSIYRVARYIN